MAAPAPGVQIRAASPDALQKAISKAKPGDTILLANGRYRALYIDFRGIGESRKPITLRAETPGQVILTGRSRLTLSGKYLVVDGLCFRDGHVPGHVVAFRRGKQELAEHCRFTNSAIIDYNPPEIANASKWISLYGVHNRVDHCHIRGKRNIGATLVVWLDGRANDHLIDHNYFGPRPVLGRNGGETIRVGTSGWSMSVSKTIVEYNVFDRCDGEIEIISNKSCENIYRHNTFLRCSGTLTLRHGNRCLVEGNFFLGNNRRGTGGIRVIGEDHRVINNYFEGTMARGGGTIAVAAGLPKPRLNEYFRVRNLVLAFNTFVGNLAPCIVLSAGLGSRGRTEPAERCDISNNIFQANRGPLFTGRATQVRWRGNIAYSALTPVSPTPGIKVIPPQLHKDLDGLWRPKRSSPAVGAAKGEYPSVREDIDGQPRPESKDVGCDQLSEANVKYRRLTLAAVGPSWLREVERVE